MFQVRVSHKKTFRTWYLKTLDEKMACISRLREGYWSDAIAVEKTWGRPCTDTTGAPRWRDKKKYHKIER